MDGSQPKATLAVAIICGLAVVSFVDRNIVALLVEPIRRDLNISDLQIGLLSGLAFILLYCIAGVPLAKIADRGNRGRLIGCGAILWGVMTVASGFAERFEWLLICRLGVGLGEATLIPAAMSLFADLYPPERRARPVSLFVGCSILGAAASPALGAGALHAAQSFGAPGGFAPWQLTFILVGLPAVVLGAIAWVAVVEPPRRSVPTLASEPPSAAFASFFREHRLWVRYFVGIALVQTVLFAMSLWTVPFLSRVHDLTPVRAGLLAAGTGGVSAVIGAFLIPYIASRLAGSGRPEAIPVFAAVLMAASVPCVAVVYLAPSLTMMLTAASLSQICIAGLYATPQILAQHLAPPSLRAQFIAISMLFANVFGAVVGGLVVPWLARVAFDGPAAIGHAIIAVAIVAMPLGIILILAARSAIRRASKSSD